MHVGKKDGFKIKFEQSVMPQHLTLLQTLPPPHTQSHTQRPPTVTVQSEVLETDGRSKEQEHHDVNNVEQRIPAVCDKPGCMHVCVCVCVTVWVGVCVGGWVRAKHNPFQCLCVC